ncbi:MAG: response regulator [Candidatus Omnitrophica bacterium]|nr:response regulator [Candidatus Omnitrophota bacterium]
MEKKKILVVDDELDCLEAIKQRLEAKNYLVVVTSKAKEVFPTAEREAPDLILLDIVMPDMNGYEICELLKQGNKTRDIPIILLTGESLEPRSITKRCLKLGADSFILKPIDIEILFSKIKELLKEE